MDNNTFLNGLSIKIFIKVDCYQIVERFKRLNGFLTDVEAGRFFGVKPTNFNGKKMRGTIAYEILEWAVHHKKDLNFIFYGEEKCQQKGTPALAVNYQKESLMTKEVLLQLLENNRKIDRLIDLMEKSFKASTVHPRNPSEPTEL